MSLSLSLFFSYHLDHHWPQGQWFLSLPVSGVYVDRAFSKQEVMSRKEQVYAIMYKTWGKCLCVYYSQTKKHLVWWPETFGFSFLFLCRICFLQLNICLKVAAIRGIKVKQRFCGLELNRVQHMRQKKCKLSRGIYSPKKTENVVSRQRVKKVWTDLCNRKKFLNTKPHHYNNSLYKNIAGYKHVYIPCCVI